MATISTPRPQSPSVSQSPAYTPSSSVRPSLDSPRLDGRAVSPAPTDPSQRRNRAALRDYYNLKARPGHRQPLPGAASTTSATGNLSSSLDAAVEAPSSISALHADLDEEKFEPAKYVEELLHNSDLQTVLETERNLISDIKNLDAERKALVYDNYNKLIAATDTIGAMRKSMDEAETGGLRSTGAIEPAVRGVVEAAAKLDKGRDRDNAAARRQQRRNGQKEARMKQETVKWVLATPARLQKTLDDGRRDDAEADWAEVMPLLQKWRQVQGAVELQAECEAVMARISSQGG